jgi:hypothetical protein
MLNNTLRVFSDNVQTLASKKTLESSKDMSATQTTQNDKHLTTR